MTYRRSFFAVLATQLLFACGGDATQSAAGPSGGAGGSAAGGQLGSAGHANGGSSSGGTSGIAGTGGQMAQCAAFPVCPVGERTAQGGECPAAPSCHSLSVCGNMIWCVTAGNDGTGGAGGAGGTSGATHDCNGSKCTATQACIAYRTEGGVAIFADAGTCPTGEHLEGTMCARDFTYKCAELHGLCQNQPVSCACAEPATNNPGVCPAGYGSCSEPGATEDTVARLFCQQLVP